MGSPRTVSRFISAPTGGEGTGGGPGNPATPAAKYDRYIGTVGPLSSKPVGQKTVFSSPTEVIKAESRESLISSLTPVLLDQTDGAGYALGMPFIPSVDGRIVAVRYYKAAGETGTHTAKIWSSTGAELRKQAFTNETASGWQQVNIRIPVTVTAGNLYIVSVNVNQAYVATAGGLATPVTSTNLTSSATQGWNRASSPSDITISNQTLEDFNYFRDVVFVPNPPTIDLPGEVSVSGIDYVGKSLTATVTDATRVTTSTTFYQWQKSLDGIAWTDIAGETNASLSITTALLGYRVRAEATYRSTAVSSQYPNFLTFPDAAERYDWVRMTANTVIGGVSVKEGEEWICTEKTTTSDPTRWDVRSPLNVPVAFMEVKRNLLSKFDLPPNEYVLVKFDPPEFTLGAVTPTDEIRTDLSMWFPSAFSGIRTYLDFDLVVNFADEGEPAGDRYIGIAVAEYSNPPALGAKNPDGSLVRGNNGVSNAPVNAQFEYPQDMILESRAFVRSSAQAQTTLRSGEASRYVEYFKELQTIFYVYVWQNSNSTIQVEKVSLYIRRRYAL